MFVENSYLHRKQFADHGEYLELEIWVGLGAKSDGHSFEDWSGFHGFPRQLLARLEKGVFFALNENKFSNLKVALVECRWLDVDSPEWLFEEVATVCVREALQKLEVKRDKAD
ncbi:MAG: hypothetical protein AAF382_15555 [Pseudomonadota bacterium]